MAEISLVTAGLALLSAIGAVVWNRSISFRAERVALLQTEDRASLALAVEAIAKLTTSIPNARLIDMEGQSRALKKQYDSVVTEVEAHRAGVHRSMQRFDQIMRRNERAAAVIEQAKTDDEEGLEVDPEEEIPETQEGDRSFLANRPPEQVADMLHERANGRTSWDDRRRAMARQYHENRGGKPQPSRSGRRT